MNQVRTLLVTMTAVVWVSAWAIGCGDDSAVAPDAPPDTTPDQSEGGFEGIGEDCPDDMCAAGLTCYGEAAGGGGLGSDEGVCSRACTNDADCGPDGFCTPAIMLNPEVAVGERICVRSCDANDDCDSEHICSRYWGIVVAFGVPGVDLQSTGCIPGSRTAPIGGPCTDIGDCAPHSECIAVEPWSTPAGECLTSCSEDTSCGAIQPRGLCVLEETEAPFCVPDCMTTDDCPIAGYECVRDDFLGASHCVYPTTPVGFPCEADTDCGPAGSPWNCLTAADGFPGGYCSGPCVADGVPCPGACHDPTPMMPGSSDEICVVDCSVADFLRMFCEGTEIPGRGADYHCVTPPPPDGGMPDGGTPDGGVPPIEPCLPR